MLLVFGGNGHNDTAYSLGSKCFTSTVLVYDIVCNSWLTLEPPKHLPTELAQYGHSSVVYGNSIYTWGGFNGIIKNDLIRFTPPTCNILSFDKCSSSRLLGHRCGWNDTLSQCTDAHASKSKCLGDSGPREAGHSVCENLMSCSACVQTYDCVWCGGQCQHVEAKCKDTKHKVSKNVVSVFSGNCELTGFILRLLLYWSNALLQKSLPLAALTHTTVYSAHLKQTASGVRIKRCSV